VHGDEWHGDSASWHDISLLLLCLLLLMLHVYEGSAIQHYNALKWWAAGNDIAL
jgi:hypothetical protein